MSNLNQELQMIFLCFAVSFTFSLSLVGIFKIFKLSDPALNEKRSAHETPTPRLGGFLALLAIVVGFFFTKIQYNMKLLVILLPILFLGILEDLGIKTSAKLRLLAGSISAALFIYMFGVWVNESNVPGLDFLLRQNLFAYIFTIFCLVGLLNSFNLIDGMNGLAAGNILLVTGAIIVLTSSYHEPIVQTLALAMFSAMLGLFVLNYPVGRIFLGDAGAYVFGFLIGISLITLKFNHPEISGWAFLLILFWPVAETTYSIVRRKIAKKAPDEPDMMHMHHLIMRNIESAFDKKITRRISNPLSTALILPLAAVPIYIAVCFPEEHVILAIFSFTFSILFILIYQVLAKGKKSKLISSSHNIVKTFKKIVLNSNKN